MAAAALATTPSTTYDAVALPMGCSYVHSAYESTSARMSTGARHVYAQAMSPLDDDGGGGNPSVSPDYVATTQTATAFARR